MLLSESPTVTFMKNSMHQGFYPTGIAPAIPVLVLSMLLIGCQGDTQELPAVADSWLPIDVDGQPASLDDEQMHHCVLDQRTGLMWEVKQPASGLHQASATWSWYEPDPNKHLSEAGQVNGGSCDLDKCDTHALVAAVNQAGLCGHHDWFLPSRDQLMTLGDRRLADSGRILDQRFFPHDPVGEYWTADTFRLYPRSAWLVDNRLGLDRAELKSEARHARLVRQNSAVEKD
jgi:hypothetical protein